MKTNINCNYDRRAVPQEWADSRETHPAVAEAIHAIADSTRSPQAIWEAPTSAEWDHVTMAVSEYLRCGYYQPSADGRYQWGVEAIDLGAPE